MNTGQPLPPGLYYRGRPGGYRSFLHLYPQGFAPWEVALTVVLAAVLVATVVVFVRRLRRV
ncbi:MAG TPA: hypothetical protein VIY26_17025 [Acidimicrobiales bacterium]